MVHMGLAQHRSLISALGSILLNQIRIYMRGLLFLPLPLFLAFAAVVSLVRVATSSFPALGKEGIRKTR